MLQDIEQNFCGRLVGVDSVDEMFSVKFQHGLGFLLVGLEPVANDFQAGVIKSVFLEGAALHALDEIINVCAAEIKDTDDVQGVAKHFRLVRAARDAIQDEGVSLRLEAAGLGVFFDGFAPEINGGLVGNEFAAARVFDENAADFAVDGEIPKHVAAGAVEKIRNGAENFPLGAFADAGRAEEENCAVFHASFSFG